MGRRLLTMLGVVVGLILAALVAGAAYTALKTPLSTPNSTNLNPENCAPGPCANVSGFKIWISNVKVENDIVRMTVKFQNSSSATHVAPEDLQLIDSGRRAGTLVTDAPNCKAFVRTEFSHGTYFGPVDVCFRVLNATPPFILHWTPDMGAFCCQRDITIWPT